MAMSLPGIESERLDLRIRFLQSRANSHLEAAGDRVLHLACAATLMRDAACVALLLERTKNARRFLLEAGHQFLELGLVAGSPLIALAGAAAARNEFTDHAEVLEGVRRQWSRSEARERVGSRRPMSDIARGAPRQMLSLMQTEWLMSEIDDYPLTRERNARVRIALERNGGYPAGETGLSIDSYVKMADWMAGNQGGMMSEIPSFIEAGLVTMAAARAENIGAAMKDGYHWRMLARPAELLDLDCVVLMSLALRAGASQALLKRIISRDVALNDAPLMAALQLRSGRL